jgi:hypothetical protein
MMDINIPNLIGGIGKAVTGIGSMFAGKLDPTAQAELTVKIAEIQAEIAKGQSLINQEEAKHPSIFVAGWRAFLGWLCGVIIGFHYLIRPLLEWIFICFGHVIELPILQLDQIIPLITGMLGLVVARSWEKGKNIDTKRVK